MIYGIIMAGGSGTRFWPESRRSKPKQLVNIAGEKTMIRATVERILPEIPFARIMVVTSAALAQQVREQVPELADDMLVVEPQGRNTAPCVALAAYKLQKRDPEAVMAVLPADHLIAREEDFRTALRTAAQVVSSGDYLLTFGIVPSRPETGYGYIKIGDVHLEEGSMAVHRVERFVEKPDDATARNYVASGQYMWNSGMFVWKVSCIIEALRSHLPSLNDLFGETLSALDTPDEADALTQVYERVEPVSVDHGIMEKAANVLCIPLDVGWNDVGSWASVEDVWDRDAGGNTARGDVVFIDAANCIVSSPHKLTALIGTDGLVVVDTPDALMICRKDNAQDVRKLQETLKARGYGHLL